MRASALALMTTSVFTLVASAQAQAQAGPRQETVGTLIENTPILQDEPEPLPPSRPLLRPRLAASLGFGTMTTVAAETRTGFGLSLSLLGGLQVSDYAAVVVEGTLFGGVDGNVDQLYRLDAVFLAEATLGFIQIAAGVGGGFGAALPSEAVNRFGSPRPPSGGPGRGVVYSGRIGFTTGSRTRFDRRGFVVSLRYDHLNATSPVHSIGLSFGVQRF